MVKQLKSLTFVNDNISNTYQVSSNTNPDWNQNDETASDYVKNRTHYVGDPVETVLLEETSIETTGEDGASAFVSGSTTLVEGYTYLVTFNGTEYECVAYCYDDWDIVIIGNGSLIDAEGGNGEPFAYMFMEGDGSDLITQEAGTYTLKIVGMIPEVVKLPAQFLMNSNVRNGEGEGSVIEGIDTAATGRRGSHAEGLLTTASGSYGAHAEGYNTVAQGDASHAEGCQTTASGKYSHAEGSNTTAFSENQHVQGKYNEVDSSNRYAHIVGNGTDINHCSNAHTLDWNGNAWFAGDVYINSTSGTDKDEGSKKLATEEYINNSISNLEENLLNKNIPEYWNEELLNKSDIIQQAMEKAGRNKSAFLWYTDAHWQNNAKVSPKLLSYLIENTPINKINFGGDIINDPSEYNHDNIKYAYEWRKMISNLSNHHSVYGNHDVNHRTTDVNNMAYAYMLAPEESNDMVVGGDSYYYIDSPSEKTRYLYLSYIINDHTEMLTQGQFIVDAIKGVQEGWHIVVIAHRWWQYTSSSSPTIGAVPAYETEILSVLDAYNAREARNGSNYFYAQDFKDAKGKVEFCIGGHIHVDYDFTTDGGIPVIITASDTNQERSGSEDEDCGTMGTVTESAVYGIIADYSDSTNAKITVVGVGRGTSRVIRTSNVKPTSISNITYSGDTTVGAAIDKTKFNFTVNYSNGTTNTIVGASSVSPATINVIGNNTVTITYTEGTVTLAGTVIIVGTLAPVVNLFNANRTFVAGTADTQIENYLDETKAYTNVAYSNGKFNASACTVSNVTENSLTVKESGIGGITVAYAFYLPDSRTNDYRITFDYSGTGKCRSYYRYAIDGTIGATNALYLNDTTGASGSADVIIPANTDNYTWLIIMLGSNTGGTKTFENITLTKVEGNNSSTNLIDSVGYNDNMRLSTSDGVTLKEATGYTTTGLIDISNYAGTVRVQAQGANFNKQTYEHAFMYTYNADGTFNTAYATSTGSYNNVIYEADADGNLTLTFNMANCADWMKRFRLTGYGSGSNLIITVN